MRITSPLKSQDNMIVLKLGDLELSNYYVLRTVRRITSGYLEVKLNINWLESSDKKTSYAKQVYRYMLSEFTLYNQVHIAYYTGGVEHSITNASIKKINDLIFSDTKVKFQINEIREKIKHELRLKLKANERYITIIDSNNAVQLEQLPGAKKNV